MKSRTWLWILFAVVGLAFLAGCTEKLTYDRWETVHIGTSPDMVEATLGEPWQKEDGTWVYYDGDRQITVTAIFEDGELVRTTWSCPDHGMQARGELIDEIGEAEDINVETFDKP